MEEHKQQNEVLNQRLEKAKEVFKDQKAQLEAKNAKIVELDAEVEKYSKAAKEAERRATELETKWNEQIADNDEAADKLAEANMKVATISWSLLKSMSIRSVMPSNSLILCCPVLLLPSVFPSIRVFSSELALCIRWPKYCFIFFCSFFEYDQFLIHIFFCCLYPFELFNL